jgi:UDP-N-acetylglucosamine 2-epimerase (non-hydrolysing)
VKKILIVFGTRPEAIKMAPLVKEFQKNTGTFETKVCVSAQHREMLDQVLDFFEITPDYDLDIMKSGQDLYDVTSNVILGMKSVLMDFNPDIVFVHGDTSTTFAASLASFYQQIGIAHIEAGLRTGDIYSPWPEEANRQLTTQIARYHFAPTLNAKNNLLKENVNEKNIEVTGNTVIDALLLALEKIKSDKQFERDIIKNLAIFGYQLHDDRKIILVTGHRRENHGQGFINICKALKEVALANPSTDIVYPVHLNPNVQKPVKRMLSGVENIYLIEPLRYEQFIYMMDRSYLIITDSGGIQEEAPSLGKPVLVMRDTTERPEALDAGTVRLVGTNIELIKNEVQELIDNNKAYKKMSKASNPYGNGNASRKIVSCIKKSLS